MLVCCMSVTPCLELARDFELLKVKKHVGVFAICGFFPPNNETTCVWQNLFMSSTAF